MIANWIKAMAGETETLDYKPKAFRMITSSGAMVIALGLKSSVSVSPAIAFIQFVIMAFYLIGW